MPEFSFPATERLKSKKQIQYIFAKGKSLKRFPLRLLYLTDPEDRDPSAIKVTMAVSGKKISNATDRNRIKRWIRESYRTQIKELKNFLEESGIRVHAVFIYLPDKLTSFEDVRRAVLELLNELKEKLGEN